MSNDDRLAIPRYDESAAVDLARQGAELVGSEPCSSNADAFMQAWRQPEDSTASLAAIPCPTGQYLIVDNWIASNTISVVRHGLTSAMETS